MRRHIALAAAQAAGPASVEANELWSAWRELAGEARFFFQSPEWIRRIAPGLEDDGVVFSAILDGRIPLAASLVKRRTRRVLGVEFVVVSDVPVGDGLPLAESLVGERGATAERVSFAELAGASGRWDVALFRHLRRGSPWLELAGADAVVIEEADHGVGVLDTSMAFEQRWASMSRNQRAKIRAAQRRAAARGAVRFETALGDDVGAAYDRHVALEARGWKGAGGTALAQDPWMRDLHREFLLVAPGAQVRTLHVGGTLAASVFGVPVGDAFVAMKVAYDEELADCSPGSVLWANLIEACCEDPAVARLDCVLWAPWLARWGTDREPTYSLIAFDRGVRGRLARLGWRLTRARADTRGGESTPARTTVPSRSQGD